MNMKGSPSGAAGTNWKGGHCTNPDGYVVIWTGPRSHKLEHREIMERKLGRKLKTSEQVHHKNGNRADNREENLEVLTRSAHRGLHNRETLAKLTVPEVVEIRMLYTAGTFNQYELADIYGVAQTQISRIVNRKRWEDVR